jgi:hypothetical protein
MHPLSGIRVSYRYLLCCALILVACCAEQQQHQFVFYPRSTEHVQHATRSFTLDEPTFIPLGSQQGGAASLQAAYQYIMDELNPNSAQFIVYPYSFSSSVSNASFPDGAVVSTTAGSLSGGASFQFYSDDTDIVFQRAQALYDVSIAILLLSSPNTVSTGGAPTTDLTYEAYTYCSVLFNWISGKYANCWSADDYLQYLQSNTSSHEKTSVVYVNQTDISSGILFNANGTPRFGILIVPDIYAGSQNQIVTMLGSAGKTQITNFVNAGATVFSSGKGALVVQQLGLVPSGTFDTSNTLFATGFSSSVNIPANSFSATSDESWVQSLLSFAPAEVNGEAQASVTSAPLVLQTTGLDVLSYWDPSQGSLYTSNSAGVPTAVASSASATAYPHMLYKTQGKGQVVVHLGNPVFQESSFSWFFNALFLSMSEPLILNGAVESSFAVIPALEQIMLTVEVTFINLYNEPLFAPNYTVWVPLGIELAAVPTGCNLINETNTPPNAALDPTYFLDCTPTGGSIAAFAEDTKDFLIQIVDVSITQAGTGIVLLYPLITYTQPSRNNRTVVLDYGPVTTSAAQAAELRTDINGDPIGIWPVLGSGNYVDNVHYVQNHGDTEALDVVYISLVPLISPFVDGSNNALIIRELDFDYGYYYKTGNDVENYPFPFKNINPTRDYDYLDYAVLGARSNILAADWDTPIKQYKLVRNSTFPASDTSSVNDTSIPNSQYAFTVTSTNTIIQQDYFIDSENFYEEALPRMTAFLDSSSPDGYQYYNAPSRFPAADGGVPSWMMNSRGDALRVNLMFARNDLYHYNVTETYAEADGVTNLASVFSIDRYLSGVSGCTPGSLGASAQKVIPGYYSDSIVTATDADSQPGYKYSEYSNGLLANCDHKNNLITPQTVVSATDDGVELIHYLVRLADTPNIQSGDDVMYFVKDDSAGDWYYAPATTEGVARFGDYPEVRILFAWGADFILNPNNTFRGGRLTITLPTGVSFNSSDPVGDGYITFSADLVAMVSTTYDPSSNQVVAEFKRGQVSDETNGANSSMQVNFEMLGFDASVSSDSFSADFELEQMFYDLSAPTAPIPFQTYEAVPEATTSLLFTKQLYVSLPALQLSYRLKRGVAGNESFVDPFESIQPYARQGTYMQDLKAHRTVYSVAEFHPVSDPGPVPLAGGDYMYMTSLGISSIPYNQYLQTGQKLMIPATPTTGRVEWSDIWGRRWVEPIRSLFIDVAPLPGPLRNFMMTTTFELLRPNTTERVLQWQSDEDLVVHAQMKLKNNYEKWFDITQCQANQILSRSGSIPTVDETNTQTQMLSWSHGLYYGSCLQGTPTYLEGEELTDAQKSGIEQAHLCADNQTFYAGCDGIQDLPHILIRPDGNTDPQWNFIQQVNDNWPAGYILADMWDLTHSDYEDSPYLIAFPFHFDNTLPSIDNGQVKPQNIITFPIYAGLGYNIAYNSSMGHPSFPSKTGWWSDNLQNRDETLVAGQAKSNLISVGSADSTLSVGWVPITDLEGVDATSRLTNIYVCEFNRYRVRSDPTNTVTAYPENVVQNNIVPIDPSLQDGDPRYTNYQCDLNTGQYDNNNISSFDNYLETATSSNWLYFAANLRGEALENINVLYTLSPLDGVYQEGLTTVQEGGRFVYWNPGLGPNTFEVVDDEVSVVNAQRTDLKMNIIVYPVVVPTFNAVVIQWLHLEDTAEINRQFTLPIYYNYYGFGDATVSVYVGGTNGTTAILSPGQATIATVEFANNAGFDWNLYANAMDSVDLGQMFLSANDLLTNSKHSIQVPTKYNFMTVNIPDELQAYVNVTPSNYFSETAPMVFDFSNTNVATIEDGFVGDYYYDIQISPDIPDLYKGKLLSFPITLNTQYFAQLPGLSSDPTGVHDYVLSIPPLVIGIPYDDDDPNFPGQVFYTSGFAHNLVWAQQINPLFTPQAVQFINASDISALQLIAGNEVDRVSNLTSYWENILKIRNDTCPFWFKDMGSSRTVFFNMSVKGDVFPFVQQYGPNQATVDLLLYSEIPQLPYGWNTVFYSSEATFNDDVGKTKSASDNIPQRVQASGPWLQLSYTGTLYNDMNVPIDSSHLHYDDAGIAQLLVTALNVGNDFAYNVNFTLMLGPDLTVLTSKLSVKHSLSGSNLTLYTGFYLPPGTPLSVAVSLNFTALNYAGAPQATSRLFIQNAQSKMDLTTLPGENTVSQELDQSLSYGLVLSTANLTGHPSGFTINLALSTDVDQQPLQYVWFRRDLNFHVSGQTQNQWYALATTSKLNYTDTVTGQADPDVQYMVFVYPSTAKVLLVQSNIISFSPKAPAAAPWWLAIAIAVPIAAVILAALIAGFIYYRKKKGNQPPKTKKAKPAPKPKTKKPTPEFSDVGVSAAAPTPMGSEPPADPSKPSKQYTVNIDYLMTGAKRVVVKDGNPTSTKPPEDHESDEEGSSDNGGVEEMGVEREATNKVPWYKKILGCF